MEAAGLFRTDGGLAIRCAATRIFGRRLLIVRPEKIGIELHQSPDAPNNHPGTVEFVSYLGAIMEYQVRLRSGEIVTVQTANRSAGDGDELLLGGGVHLRWPPEACLDLDEELAPDAAPASIARGRPP